MEQFFSILIQKIIAVSLGLCAINYQPNDGKYAQVDSSVTAFEIRIGSSNHGFTATMDTQSGSTNLDNLGASSKSHLKSLSLTFGE